MRERIRRSHRIIRPSGSARIGAEERLEATVCEWPHPQKVRSIATVFNRIGSNKAIAVLHF
jgi:hypothetical protein